MSAPPPPLDAIYRIMLSEALTLLYAAGCRERSLRRALAAARDDLRRYTAAQTERPA